jgi:hypothetical protein
MTPGIRASAAHLFVALAVLALAPHGASAQGTPAAQSKDIGWWVGAGGGYLAGRASCSNCETDPPFGDGSAVLVQGGVRAGERLHIGGELFTTTREMNGASLRDTHLLGIFQFRPFTRFGFFLKGGYGMALVKDVIPVTANTQFSARTWGMGVMYGAGWIFGQSKRVSVAPTAATYVTTVGDVRGVERTAQNVVINGWFAGAVVMFR